jgi:hypothetical protein
LAAFTIKRSFLAAFFNIFSWSYFSIADLFLAAFINSRSFLGRIYQQQIFSWPHYQQQSLSWPHFSVADFFFAAFLKRLTLILGATIWAIRSSISVLHILMGG